MVANDGRESLRGILRAAGKPHEDEDLRYFKRTVASSLSGAASALLCDQMYGDDAIAQVQSDGSAGLVVAVDALEESRFGPLHATTLDRSAVERAAGITAVSALKFFVFWRRDESSSERERDVRDFVDACRELGVLSLLEGVVTDPVGSPGFDEALRSAAREFAEFRPDLYKTQVPGLGTMDMARIEEESHRLTETLDLPWVILSNGVPDDRFAEVVESVCRGGASGALAGRGMWRPAVAAASPEDELRTAGVERVNRVRKLVDRFARPWHVATGVDIPSPAG